MSSIPLMREQEQSLEEFVQEFEKKKEAEVAQFLHLISPELRTHLVPIKAYVGLLQAEKFGTLNQKQKEKLQVIDTSINELNQMISKLADFQKIKSFSVR